MTRDLEMRQISGLWQDFFTILTLKCTRISTASRQPELLREAGVEEELIHAICSHGYGITCDVKPEHQMEKVLFAVDELTGLVGAAAKMRPSRSVMDMEVSSLKKKFKDKKFAAGCSRDVIREGAENLGWTLEELMEKTILAMRSCEESINKEMEG